MPAETFESKDAIPEEFREAAIETKDGRFLVVRDEDTSGLKSALEKERGARKEAEKAAKERAARLQELELEAKASKEGLTTDKLKEIRQQVAAEYEPFKAKAEQYAAENRALKLNDRVKALLAKAEFVDAEVAWKLFGEQFDLTEDGQPIVKDAPGTSLDAHIAKIAEAHPYLVKGSQIAGGGAAGAKAGAAPASPTKVSALTGDALQAYIAKHGYETWKQQLDAESIAILTAKPQQKAA